MYTYDTRNTLYARCIPAYDIITSRTILRRYHIYCQARSLAYIADIRYDVRHPKKKRLETICRICKPIYIYLNQCHNKYVYYSRSTEIGYIISRAYII